MSGRFDPAALAAGVEAGRRADLGRAITLVESTRDADRPQAEVLVERLLPRSGNSVRVAVTGAPGVGKSTLIESLGLQLIETGHKVAVLAVDPSSIRTGGSILGDKTRMGRLAREADAFIRPSPSAGTLGGVARRTRESIVLCEAAGFDVVLVETVGVGQSEAVVADMVDFFMVLVLAGSGDELQGIKRGILELADLVTISKADGDNLDRARRTQHDYRQALSLLPPKSDVWSPPVTACSAATGEGLDELWQAIVDHRDAMMRAGQWEQNRRRQRKRWLQEALHAGLLDALKTDPAVAQQLGDLQPSVEDGTLSPERAARQVLERFLDRTR